MLFRSACKRTSGSQFKLDPTIAPYFATIWHDGTDTEKSATSTKVTNRFLQNLHDPKEGLGITLTIVGIDSDLVNTSHSGCPPDDVVFLPQLQARRQPPCSIRDGFIDIAAVRTAVFGSDRGFAVLLNRQDGSFGAPAYYDSGIEQSFDTLVITSADLAGDEHGGAARGHARSRRIRRRRHPSIFQHLELRQRLDLRVGPERRIDQRSRRGG